MPSSDVVDELSEKLPAFAGAAGTVVFHTKDGSAFTAEQRTQISGLVASAQDLDTLTEAIDPFVTEVDRAQSAAKLADGTKQLDAARKQIADGQKQLNAARVEIDGAQAQLDMGKELAATYGLDTSQFAAHQAQIDAGRAEIDKQQKKLDSGRAELEANAVVLEQGQTLQDLAAGIQMVSDDKSVALVQVIFSETRLELTPESQDAVVEHFTSSAIDGVEVDFSADIVQGIPQVLGVGEAVGVAIAAVVLLVMLGSVVAASFPIVTAMVGVAVGVMSALAFSSTFEMASVTPVLGVMLGLAVGIDYSLFIVNRHRKQLLQGSEIHESIGFCWIHGGHCPCGAQHHWYPFPSIDGHGCCHLCRRCRLDCDHLDSRITRARWRSHRQQEDA
jgi:RND superfamily putative drug exporter